jgi:hypothetical protein
MSESLQLTLANLLRGQPYAVPVEKGRVLAGDKGRTQIYDLVKEGKLQAIKDGSKTLIVTESIYRYMMGLPSAELAEPSRLADADKRHNERRKRRPKKRLELPPISATKPSKSRGERARC